MKSNNFPKIEQAKKFLSNIQITPPRLIRAPRRFGDATWLDENGFTIITALFSDGNFVGWRLGDQLAEKVGQRVFWLI